MNLIQSTFRLLALVAAMFAGFLFVGCDNKETVLDVDTPDGGVEVERDRSTGELTVDVE
jgi:hypothetical protein